MLQANSLPGRLEGRLVHTAVGALELLEPLEAPSGEPPRAEPPGITGGEREVLVLPDSLEFQADPEGEAWVLGREFLGQEWAYWVQWEGQRLRLRLPLSRSHGRGERGVVRLRSRGTAWLFPEGRRLRACPAVESPASSSEDSPAS